MAFVQFPFEKSLVDRLKPVAEANDQVALDFIVYLMLNAIETYEQKGSVSARDS